MVPRFLLIRRVLYLYRPPPRRFRLLLLHLCLHIRRVMSVLLHLCLHLLCQVGVLCKQGHRKQHVRRFLSLRLLRPSQSHLQ